MSRSTSKSCTAPSDSLASSRLPRASSRVFLASVMRSRSKSLLCSAIDSLASTMASLARSRGSSPRTPEHPPRKAENRITTRSARQFIMCAMNEESLPSFAHLTLRSFPGALRHVLNRLFGRLRRRGEDAGAPDDPALRSRAASVIREYADVHATLFERAERLRDKVERLERAGTPSESARNRAERARGEVEAGLAAPRG